MTNEQRQKIVARLNGRTQLIAFEAAKSVWENPDPLLKPSLIRILKRGRRPFNRAAAAFAMQIVHSSKTIRALENVVRDKSESPRVRGESAEALAHYHRKESHRVLLDGLADPNKEVRFWCAFALAEMAEKKAIPILERLVAYDKRMVKGFRSVAKEAGDALKSIQMGNVGYRRKQGCVFCSRH
jgi:hypothetical protein